MHAVWFWLARDLVAWGEVLVVLAIAFVVFKIWFAWASWQDRWRR